MNASDTDEPCYLCGERELTHKAVVSGLSLVECRKCKIIYVPAGQITRELLEAFYSKAYYQNDSLIGYAGYQREEAIHRKNAGHLLDYTLGDLGVARPRMLDVGCAFGYLLDEARKRGCDVTGVEMSDYARNHAVSTLGINVHSTLDSVVAEGAQFDVVFMLGTIEHLTDARGMTDTINKVLKPGGQLVITTIDTKGFFPLYALKPPEHTIYFSHANLALMLGYSGFSVQKRKTYFTHYLLSDLFHRLSEFFRIGFFNRLSRLFEKRFPRMSVLIPTNEMILLARKERLPVAATMEKHSK